MKKLFTLVALLTCFMGAKAEKVYEIDYSTYTGFPFYVMGFVPEWEDGIMTDYGSSYLYKTEAEAEEGGLDTSTATPVYTNNNTLYYRWETGGGWHQYFIADDIPTGVGGSYKVKALVRASANVSFNVNMGWGWGSGESTGATVSVPQSDDFVEVEWEYSGIGATRCNLVAQPGGSTVTIEWKSLAVYTADPKLVTTYGEDLVDVEPTMYIRNYGMTAEELKTLAPATPDADGVYTTTDEETAGGDPWETQFWIAGEYPLPAGQKFYVEFDYMADAAGTVGTQAHRATPGDYITWHCIGNVDFTDEWNHFEKEATIEGDMSGWQSIAFNMHLKTNNSYHIKNVVLKEVEVLGEAIVCTVGKSEWTSYFSNEKDVALVDEVTAYGAVYNSETHQVDLIEVEAGQVPYGEAVLINGAAGGYNFEVIGSAAGIDDNDLEAYDIDQNSNGKYYALANGSKGIGFYPVKEGEVIPAGKAFLDLSNVINAPAFVPLAGTTSINEKTIVKNNAEVVYNLAGQRVAQPAKGLYIVNGKKVIK
jgi:hypothetical protein